MILQAFHDVKPALILSVPLVVEKIFKKQVLPIISKPIMKVILNIPGINRIILNKIHTKLFNAFGGNFKELVLGGAAFNPEAEHFFKKIKFPFTVGYGMTECGPLISYHNWRENPIGSSGRIVDTLEIKVDSPDPAKVAGEIIVRGENVMYGYYKNKEATDEVLDSDGWLHTGDVVVQDEDGFLFIVDRKKDMIIAGGFNIYPREIDEVLSRHPKIEEAITLGIEDPYRGETVKAFIVPKRGETITAEEIILFCKERLAPYKVPKEIEFRAELPKSAVGKILRKILRDEELRKRSTN